MLQPKKKIVKTPVVKNPVRKKPITPVDDYKTMKDPATGKKGTMGGEGTTPPFSKGEKRAVPNPMEMARKNKAKNGKSFPDLNKDGKITRADILKGRGVIAKKGVTIKKAQNGRRTDANTTVQKFKLDAKYDKVYRAMQKDSTDFSNKRTLPSVYKQIRKETGKSPSVAELRKETDELNKFLVKEGKKDKRLKKDVGKLDAKGRADNAMMNKMKMGGAVKKAQNGTYQPMGKNSRKVGEGKYVSEDGNYKLKFKGGSDTSAPTSAVQRRTLKGFLKGAPKAGFKTKIAKSGTSMKKCRYGCK
jgi:hypothetical protein